MFYCSTYLINFQSIFKDFTEHSDVGVWLESVTLTFKEFVLELDPMETKGVEEAL